MSRIDSSWKIPKRDGVTETWALYPIGVKEVDSDDYVVCSQA